MTFPSFFTVRQELASHRIADLQSELVTRLGAHSSVAAIKPTETVCLAVGSRGIDRIDEITRTVAGFFSQLGAQPFVVPAMGSHGGATAEGQAAVLASLGITNERVGCPIRSSMETVEIGKTDDGMPIFHDKHALGADHLVVINRIKPHTKLTGTIQSGLCKMLMIGLGKHRGAIHFHPAFRSMDHRLDRVIPQVIPMISEKTSLRLGIALVEDANDHVGKISLLEPATFHAEEPALLQNAIDWMPKIPFRSADLLIIDRIGKEISGTGMDTNVIGRKWHDKLAGEDEWPKIHEIYVRSLTEKTAGNASGIGIAEYTHKRVATAMDAVKTRINCITANHPTAAALPVWFDCDRDVLDAVCAQRPVNANQRRWIRIRDTLDLSRLQCSLAYLEESEQRSDLQRLGDPLPLEFDEVGNLSGGDNLAM